MMKKNIVMRKARTTAASRQKPTEASTIISASLSQNQIEAITIISKSKAL